MATPTQQTRSSTVTVSATSQQVCPQISGGFKRTQLMIFPLTAGVTVTIDKSDNAAVANQGIVLVANQPYVEATDGGYICWQGPVQCVASGAGSISVVESFIQTQ